jgi:hypothetical protein
MPPLSPAPADRSAGSMSACRKSWATVRPPERVDVDEREARDICQEPAPRRTPLEQLPESGRGRPLAEGRDRRHEDRFGLAVVVGDTQERPARRRIADQAEGLDEPRACLGFAHAEQRTLDAHHERLGHHARPLLERALGQHAGEASVDDHPEQSSDRREPGQSGSQRPRRMLAEELALVGEQPREHAARLVVEHTGERVRRGDRDELVRALQRLLEEPDGPDAGIPSGFERQVVGESHGIDDGRCLHHGIECGLDPHGGTPGS